MADEQVTDVTNSEASTQTDEAGATDNLSSNTETTQADAASGEGTNASAEDNGGEGDGLEGASILAGDQAGDEGADKGEGEKSGDGDPELTGAPEGDYDLTEFLPEGEAIDANALAAIAPTAKALNLSNAGLAKLATEGQGIVLKQVQDAQVRDVMNVRAGWDNDTRAAINGGVNTDGATVERDPVFQGRSFNEVTAVAAKAIDRFAGDKLFPAAKADGSPGTFRDFLKSTGLGNHPAMVQFAYLAGSSIAEDSDLPRNGGVVNAPKSREEKYYGSQ